MRLGLSVKSFGTDRVNKNDYFIAFSPYLAINFGERKARHAFHHDLLIQGIVKNDVAAFFSKERGFFVQHTSNYRKPAYQAQWVNRYENFDVGYDFVSRIWTNLNQNFNYSVGKMDRSVSLNIFGGYTLNQPMSGVSTERLFWSMNGLNGQQDLFLEDYNFGRSDVSGIWSQQRMDRHGQFHTGFSDGSNINWLTTASVYAQLPIKPNFFGVFADFGAAPGVFQTVETYYNAGVALRLGKVFGIYFPLVYGNSETYIDLYSNYAQSIRFSLRINPVNRLGLHALLNS
jgi:hypothetical protein